jgi:anthranilate phosphoribosyltransferase
VIAAAAQRVRGGSQLSRAEMRDLITAIVDAGADEAAVADLLTALHARGESLEEIIGAAEGMRALATPLPRAPEDAIDTCGTGGDRSGSFNISTVAALVVAGAGVPVAKHGNRAATSLCGSADLLEELGVELELAPERMAESVRAVGIGFLFARACHPAMARVAPIRARLDTPTIFNRLGPLTNPMYVRRQLVGVADAGALEETREALVALGAEHAWVVHSEDGLDEISLSAPARVAAFESGSRREFRIEPGAFVPEAPREALLGGSPIENAAIAREVLGGAKGPRRDVVLLNAAAALCVAGRAAEIAPGVEQAAAAIDSGRARDLLARWIRFSASAAKGTP